MLKSLAFALFAVAAPFQDPGTGTIKGWIRSDRTGEPLPYAAVEVVGADEAQAVLEDVAVAALALRQPPARGRQRLVRFPRAALQLLADLGVAQQIGRAHV